jgi:hypothetical protein
MSRLLDVAAGLVAAVLFAFVMTGLDPLRLVFWTATVVLVLWRGIPEMLLGPSDPPLPPAGPALAETTTTGFVGRRRTRLTVRVHPDRIMVGRPFLGRRTIMADRLTEVVGEPTGAVRIDHVATAFRSAPVRLPLAAGHPLRAALEEFTVSRPPLPARARRTFLRVWPIVAGSAGAAIGVYQILSGHTYGATTIATSICFAAMVWFLLSRRR